MNLLQRSVHSQSVQQLCHCVSKSCPVFVYLFPVTLFHSSTIRIWSDKDFLFKILYFHCRTLALPSKRNFSPHLKDNCCAKIEITEVLLLPSIFFYCLPVIYFPCLIF